MITNLPHHVQNLDSPVRVAYEENPITVRPYMITANDLAEIGHAACRWCPNAKIPTWLVNGWACCDNHLPDLISAARDFNFRTGIWVKG